MSLLKRAAETVFHRGGGLAWVRRQHRRGLRVLMYHRFAAQARGNLVQQCEHLRKHYTIVPLAEAVARLQQGQALADNSIAITVDDGYRDFYETVFPIFRQFEIPALVFLTTDFLDRKMWMWWDRIEYAAQQSPRASVTVETPEGPRQLDLSGNAASKSAAAASLAQQAKRWPNQARLRMLARLGEDFGVAIPEAAPANCEPLTWDEVRKAAAGGMHFGGHTRSHPILTRLETREQLHDEVAGCKARIDQELGGAAKIFCYPNGQPGDYSEEIIDVARQAGYSGAVTAEVGVHPANGDPFRIKRIGAEPELDSLYFHRRVAGFRAQ